MRKLIIEISENDGEVKCVISESLHSGEKSFSLHEMAGLFRIAGIEFDDMVRNERLISSGRNDEPYHIRADRRQQ